MNRDQVEGNWKQLKGRARQKWGKLTDDQLDRSRGRREELAGQLQEAYGKSKEEAEREVDEWMRTVTSDETTDPSRRTTRDTRH